LRFPQGRRSLAAALLILGLGACSTREQPIDPDSAERVVVEGPGRPGRAAPDADAKQARAEAALDAALAAWRSGDALTALSLANHAMLEGIPSELEAPFRELRSKARASVVATKICRVRALPEKDVVADGEPIAVRIEFSNLSSTLLSVPRSQKGASDATVVLTLVREDIDVFGNSRRSEFTIPAPVREDLTLSPGQSFETRLVVPPGMAGLQHQGFSVIELSGVFRPIVMRVGESEFFDAIPIERARVRIFQKGFEPLAEDPLGSLRKAVAKRSPPHLLIAAELVAPIDRPEARAVLEAAKPKDPELGTAIDAALARLTPAR
jgi:hypothetical protein